MIRSDITQECYSFENLNEMQRILQFDCISDYDIDENTKWIEYTLDRRYCIRLKDLVHQIKEDVIRFHLGQLLMLVKKILEKLDQWEQNKIKHEFLDLNRIWIKLGQQSQNPKIYYQKLTYEIHFTGYQCPFYEKQSCYVNPSIRQILKDLMNDCFVKIKLQKSDDNFKIQIFDNTIMRIFSEINKPFNEIVTKIDSMLKTFEYDLTDQTLNVDDKVNDKVGSVRFRAMADIYKANQSISEAGSKFSQTIRESIWNCLIPKYPYIFIHPLFNYQSFIIQQSFKDFFQIEFQKPYERTQKLNSALNEKYKQLYEKKLKEIELHFKFNFDKQSQAIQKEVIDSVIISREMKYFENTCWLEDQNDNFFQHMKVQALKALDYLLQDRLNLEIQQKQIQFMFSIY